MVTLAQTVDAIRRQRRAARVARVCVFVWLGVLLVLGGRFDAFAPFMFVLLVPAWLISTYLSFRARTQICPRCHLQLAVTGRWGRLVVVPRCPHCGLPIEGKEIAAST
jgi:hypothetical protein